MTKDYNITGNGLFAMTTKQTHSVAIEGKKLTWNVERLWELAEALQPYDYPVSAFTGFDQDCWFGDKHQPTVRKVLEHCEKILNADYSHPIILSEPAS